MFSCLSVRLESEALNKMQNMLRYNPAERISAKAALDHPTLTALTNLSSEAAPA